STGRGVLTACAGVWGLAPLARSGMTRGRTYFRSFQRTPESSAAPILKKLGPYLRGDERSKRIFLRQHPQRVQVGFQDRFLLLALVDVLLAHPHHCAQRFHIVAVGLGLGIAITHVVGDRLLFFFEPLDALDKSLELVLRETVRGLFVSGSGGSGGGGSSGHQLLPSDQSLRRTNVPARSPTPEARSLFAEAFEVTCGRSRRGRAHPQYCTAICRRPQKLNAFGLLFRRRLA